MIDYTLVPFTATLVGGPYCGAHIKPRYEQVFPASPDSPKTFMFSDENNTLVVDGGAGEAVYHFAGFDDYDYLFCNDCTTSF